MNSRDIMRTVKRMLRPVEGRVRGVVTRGVLSALNHATKGQTATTTGRSEDIDQDVEIFQEYGWRSSPPVGAEGLILRVGGAREHPVGILFHDRATAPSDVLPGEVCVYHPPTGARLLFRADGSIELTPAAGQVVKIGEVAGGLPVARSTDPVNCPDITAILAACTAFVAGPPDGGAALATAIAAAITNGGNGTITAGGTGSVST